MSKQQEAKQRQDYVAKAIPQTCSVCIHCAPVMGDVLRYKDRTNFTTGGTHMVVEQVSQKCGIGGFAVKKMGSCSLWAGVPA